MSAVQDEKKEAPTVEQQEPVEMGPLCDLPYCAIKRWHSNGVVTIRI